MCALESVSDCLALFRYCAFFFGAMNEACNCGAGLIGKTSMISGW